MRKSMMMLAPVAAILFAGTSISHAASNAEITITGNVVASTCDVSVSNPNLDLGNFAKAAFTGVATPVPASIKTFTVGLSNCGTPLAAGDKAGIIVSGQTLGGNPNIFNSTGTNTGVMLSPVATPTAYISAGQKLNIATAGTTPAVGDFNGKSIRLQAGLASSSATPDIGMVNAPVLFSFAYN